MFTPSSRAISSASVVFPLQRRARSRPDIHAQLARDQLGQGRLPQTRRPEEQRVIQRLSARQRRIYIDAERFLHPVLANELGQALRAKRELDYALFGDDFGSGYLCS
jgi:hypothetical protein